MGERGGGNWEWGTPLSTPSILSIYPFIPFSQIYSEKQLKDDKIILTILHLRKIISKQRNVKRNLRVIGYDTVPRQMYQPSLMRVHKPKKNRAYIFCCKLDLVSACFQFPTIEKFIVHLSVIAPYNATFSSPKMSRYGISGPI